MAPTITYRAVRQFLERVTLHTGVGAAKIRLEECDASDGFTRVWEAQVLGRSVEVALLKTKYEALFTVQERRIESQRLEFHEFDVDEFIRQS